MFDMRQGMRYAKAIKIPDQTERLLTFYEKMIIIKEY